MEHNSNKNLDQLKQAFADGTELLNDDEYLGDDGLPYCKICHTAKYWVLDDGTAGRGVCDCIRQMWKDFEEKKERTSRVLQI